MEDWSLTVKRHHLFLARIHLTTTLIDCTTKRRMLTAIWQYFTQPTLLRVCKPATWGKCALATIICHLPRCFRHLRRRHQSDLHGKTGTKYTRRVEREHSTFAKISAHSLPKRRNFHRQLGRWPCWLQQPGRGHQIKRIKVHLLQYDRN